jgi:protein transport protein SEC61 subunit alpha
MLGGIVIGFLTILGDLMNVIGSSTGILLSVNILYGFYEKMGNKKKTEAVEY